MYDIRSDAGMRQPQDVVIFCGRLSGERERHRSDKWTRVLPTCCLSPAGPLVSSDLCFLYYITPTCKHNHYTWTRGN